MKKYTKEQFLLAAELGEVSMIDAKYVVSLLDEVVEMQMQKKANPDCALNRFSKECSIFIYTSEHLRSGNECNKLCGHFKPKK